MNALSRNRLRHFVVPVVIGGCIAVQVSDLIPHYWVGHPPIPLVLVATTAIYSLVVAAIINTIRRLDDARVLRLLIAVVATTVILFVLAYLRFGPGKADSDDALDILAESMIEGDNPYVKRTFLGQTISPMMGAVVFAVPFWFTLGAASYQNVMWVLVGSYVLWKLYGDRVALAIVCFVVGSVGFHSDFVLGGDYYISGVPLALGAFAFAHSVDRRTAWRYGAAVFFGIVATNRLSTLPMLALMAALVLGARRFKDGAGPLALATVVSGALWVPWWLADPANYVPITRREFLGPPAAQLLVVVGFLLLLALAVAGRLPAGSPNTVTARLERYGIGLALILLPIALWEPARFSRVTPFLFLAVPAAVKFLGPLLSVSPARVDAVELSAEPSKP